MNTKIYKIYLLLPVCSILMNTTLYAFPQPLYIALNHNKASQQIRQCINYPYIQMGSDSYYYDMDAWRNYIVSKLDIHIEEWPEHNEPICPAIKFGKHHQYQSLPEGIFAEPELWFFFFEYLIDIYEYENRIKLWMKLENYRYFVFIKYNYHSYNESSEDCEYDMLFINPNFKKLNTSQKPIPIKCPITNWEYK